ncbi:MAG: cold-shock protein [Planctomycetes bacterium]|nr:cold-shock protein [Planctomycetota bacterium]
MPRGQVKWFDPKKGYGFLVGPEGQDVFVHYSQIQSEGFRALKDGEWVDYELVQGDKGFQARDVKQPSDGATPPRSSAPVDKPASARSAAPPPVSGGYQGADD